MLLSHITILLPKMNHILSHKTIINPDKKLQSYITSSHHRRTQAENSSGKEKGKPSRYFCMEMHTSEMLVVKEES